MTTKILTGPQVGQALMRFAADARDQLVLISPWLSRRAVAPAERGPARALGASKRHKPREWPRSGVQPQRYAALLARD